MKNENKEVRHIRKDNAGENVNQLKDNCKKKGIKVELTPPNSPQYNGVVERRFFTDKERAMEMLINASLNTNLRDKLWDEAVSTSENMGNISTSTRDNSKSPYELYYGRRSMFHKYLKEFGRIGYVKQGKKHQKKLEPRYFKCIFVGYANSDHATDIYRMYNPRTNKIILSRNVTWEDWKMKLATDDPVIQDVKIPTEDETEPKVESKIIHIKEK